MDIVGGGVDVGVSKSMHMSLNIRRNLFSDNAVTALWQCYRFESIGSFVMSMLLFAVVGCVYYLLLCHSDYVGLIEYIFCISLATHRCVVSTLFSGVWLVQTLKRTVWTTNSMPTDTHKLYDLWYIWPLRVFVCLFVLYSVCGVRRAVFLMTGAQLALVYFYVCSHRIFEYYIDKTYRYSGSLVWHVTCEALARWGYRRDIDNQLVASLRCESMWYDFE